MEFHSNKPATTSTAKPQQTASYYEQKINTASENDAFELQLNQTFAVAETFLMQSYLDRFSHAPIAVPNGKVKDYAKIKLIKVSRVVFDPEEENRDKLISVYSALNTLGSSVAMVICGKGKDVDFYFAVRSERSVLHAMEVLEKTLSSNFPGTQFSAMNISSDKKKQIFLPERKRYSDYHLATVSLIPSERDEDKEKFVQGIEKFIDGMNGEEYTAIFLASPVRKEVLEERKHGFEELSSNLSSHAKITMAYGHNQSLSVNKSISDNFSHSVNESLGSTSGTSESTSNGLSKSYGTSSNFGGGSHGDGGSSNWGFGSNSSTSHSTNYTSGTSFSRSVTNGTTDTTGTTQTDGTTKTIGTNDTITLNFDNKAVMDLIEKADGELKRIDKGFAYGACDVACYFYSENYATAVTAASICKALFTGDDSNIESAHINVWDNSIPEQADSIELLLENICHLVHPVALIPAYGNFSERYVTPTNMVTVNELPIMFNLPKKSVNGVAVVEMAEFGREVVYERVPSQTIDFGRIYHMGRIDGVKMEAESDETLGTRVPLSLPLLSSHCFITGSSGSGKSHATYRLLNELLDQGIKMLVIEPAKGEYKQIFGSMPEITIYNTDPKLYHLLRLNPFEFPASTHVSVHMTKLLNIFKSSWDLTAAMPNLLEDAVQQAYVSCGWDINNSICVSGISDHKFPTFRDVMKILPDLIDKSDYSNEVKGNYKGSLLTRVKSMTNGLVGMIFERDKGISDKDLFDRNVIIDLSEVGSDDTISLIMGVLVMKLKEYREHERKVSNGDDTHDSRFQHVVVLEEAHNLLKRTSTEQSNEGSNVTGAAVKAISNSIKEMRTYGEGFLIIDQSPMALDTSAIENTSTKIIFNTPGKDACDELGSALSLNDMQIRELSRLGTGVAAVFQKGWLTPVLMKVDSKIKYDFSAKLQKQNDNGLQAVRGSLAYELYLQAKQKRYDKTAFSVIIAEACKEIKPDEYRLTLKRKNSALTDAELDRMVNDAIKNRILNERAEEFRFMMKSINKDLVLNAEDRIVELGKCFVTITGCLGMFEILEKSEELDDIYIDVGYFCWEYKQAKNAEKKKQYRAKAIQKRRKFYELWQKRFRIALQNYISLPLSINADDFMERVAYWTVSWYRTQNLHKESSKFYAGIHKELKLKSENKQK